MNSLEHEQLKSWSQKLITMWSNPINILKNFDTEKKLIIDLHFITHYIEPSEMFSNRNNGNSLHRMQSCESN